MAIKKYKKGVIKSVSTNFKTTEFDCNGKGCCSTTLIDDKLVKYLQDIRNYFNKPVKICSSYRCKIHNPKVGGVKSSKHLKGMAADIKVDGVEPAEVAKYAESVGVLGIGLYDTDKDGHFVHIDTRTKKGFWFGHAQEKRTTFGGVVITESISVEEWQKAAIADGFKFPKYGADGKWGKECEKVAKEAICKKLVIGYKNKNLTKLIQRAFGIEADGKFGKQTHQTVVTWQTLIGLPANGVVNYSVWKKILGI